MCLRTRYPDLGSRGDTGFWISRIAEGIVPKKSFPKQAETSTTS